MYLQHICADVFHSDLRVDLNGSWTKWPTSALSETLNTSATKEFALGPLLFSLYTFECISVHCYNTINQFADDSIIKIAMSASQGFRFRDAG